MQRGKEKSGLAIASFILGLVSFIPLVGILLGALAIIIGFISLSKIKKYKLEGRSFAITGIILGICGALFTVILYGVLFFLLFNSEYGTSSFNEQRILATKEMILENKGQLELYKKNNGHYPQNLSVLENSENYLIWPTDHFLEPFYYSVSPEGQSYVIKSSGPDKILGTLDDVF